MSATRGQASTDGKGFQNEHGQGPSDSTQGLSGQTQRFQKVFHKLCTLSDTMEAIEDWLDSRSDEASAPPVTLDNLDLHLAGEDAAARQGED